MAKPHLKVEDVLDQTLPSGWELVGIGIGLVVLIWLTFRVKAFFHDDDAGSGRTSDLLSDVRELRREGGLSEEEFRLIKTRLVRGPASGQRPLNGSANPAGMDDLPSDADFADS
jgi:hypothetical protein